MKDKFDLMDNLKSLSFVKWRDSVNQDDFPSHIEINVFGVGKILPANANLPRQVHGNIVLDADRQTELQKFKNAPDEDAISHNALTGDGFITTQKNKILAVRTADCLPILIYGQNESMAVSLHAGWKGFSVGIIEEGMRSAQSKGVPAKAMGAFIGPSIGIEAFEVGPEVLETFASILDPHDLLLCITKGINDRWHLDLQMAACLKLIRLGIPSNQISVLRQCTKRNLAYHSFRREGLGCGHNFTTIEIKG